MRICKIKNQFTIIILILTASSCASSSPGECLVKQITNAHEKREKKQHKLILVGAGSSIPDNIHAFILHFYAYQSLTKEDARQLVIDVVEDLIGRVRDNADIQKYLNNRPFDVKNYELRITFQDSENRYPSPPFVAFLVVKSGKITYFYNNNLTGRLLDGDAFDENYEEALRRVENSSD